MNPGVIASIELVLFIRARLAAGEPKDDVIDWLVTEKGWSMGPSSLSKGAVAWVDEVIQLSPKSVRFEHLEITEALRKKFPPRAFKCGTCGQVVYENHVRCNNCWEIEKRLHQYLASEKGRNFVRDLLAAGPVNITGEEALAGLALKIGVLRAVAASLVGDGRNRDAVVRLLAPVLADDKMSPERVRELLMSIFDSAVLKEWEGST